MAVTETVHQPVDDDVAHEVHLTSPVTSTALRGPPAALQRPPVAEQEVPRPEDLGPVHDGHTLLHGDAQLRRQMAEAADVSTMRTTTPITRRSSLTSPTTAMMLAPACAGELLDGDLTHQHQVIQYEPLEAGPQSQTLTPHST